jgi:hypothetical protein
MADQPRQATFLNQCKGHEAAEASSLLERPRRERNIFICKHRIQSLIQLPGYTMKAWKE